jgi:hypothetical protein
MKLVAAVMVMALGSTTALANDREDEPETNTVVITEKGSPFWAGVAVSSAVVNLGLISAGFYYHAKMDNDLPGIRVSKPEAGAITPDDCGRTDIDDKNGVFASVCTSRKRAIGFKLAGLLTLPLVAVTTYLGFFRVTKREVRTVALVPTVTTETAGLTLDVRW